MEFIVHRAASLNLRGKKFAPRSDNEEEEINRI